MKITKSYLRQLIVESLNEEEVSNTNPYFLVGTIKGTLKYALEALDRKEIEKAKNELAIAMKEVSKLQSRLEKEKLPTVDENLEEVVSLKGPIRGVAHKAKSIEDLRNVGMSSGQGIVAVAKYAKELAASSDPRNKAVGENMLNLLGIK